MKKAVAIVLGLLTFAFPVVFLFCAPDIIIYIAKAGIEKTFVGSSVSIGKCVFHPLRSIDITYVQINKEGVYDIRLNGINVSYGIKGLLAGHISEIRSGGGNISMDLRRLKPGESGKLLNTGTGPGFFSVGKVVVQETGVDLKTQGISLSGTLAIDFHPDDRNEDRIDAVIRTIKAFGISVEEAEISGAPYAGGAVLTARKITCGDAVISGVGGIVKVENDSIVLDQLAGTVFNGMIRGKAEMDLRKDGRFTASIDLTGLDLGTFIRDFKLAEKVEVTGTIGGGLRLAGSMTALTGITGEFSTDIPGGVLVIKDTTFLANMAKRTGQSIDMLMENFSRYVYNKGGMKVGFNGRDMSLDIEMEGEAGKRTFNVVLHDIFKKGEEGI
ncbi:MAG: YdbH domain-containing protein [Candidatus Omnitrophica bacterium]|nr:YdbH domain-containing protein [Candidatus Omnitrophota bacterium]